MFRACHERDHSGHVGLEREDLQVEHQFQMVGELGRDAGRPLYGRKLARGLLFGHLDAAFDVPHAVEIFGQPRFVLGSDLVHKTRSGIGYRIEYAAFLVDPGQPDGWIGAAAVTKQALEDGAGPVFDRSMQAPTLVCPREWGR